MAWGEGEEEVVVAAVVLGGGEVSRLSAVMAPWNSNESRVDVKKAGAVPMSCSRQASARVEGERAPAWEGNCCWRMAVAAKGSLYSILVSRLFRDHHR